MYYFKRLKLINKKEKLLKQKSELIKKAGGLLHTHYGSELEALNTELDGIDELLEYLEKFKYKNKVSNNSFIAAAKNDSGAHFEFPIEK